MTETETMSETETECLRYVARREAEKAQILRDLPPNLEHMRAQLVALGDGVDFGELADVSPQWRSHSEGPPRVVSRLMAAGYLRRRGSRVWTTETGRAALS